MLSRSARPRAVGAIGTLPRRAPTAAYSGASYTWARPEGADALSAPSPEQVFMAGMRHHHIANTAYPISHLTTCKPYRVPRTRDQRQIREVLQGAYGPLDELMLYVHCPTCEVRCEFCEYTVIDPKVGKTEEAQTAYINALLREFELYDELLNTRNKTLVGFDIGGGTPGLLRHEEIGRIMDAADRHFTLPAPDAMHVSIETTPRIAARDPAKLREYHAMGIRRISMGVQTTDFREAKAIGRDDANSDSPLDTLRLAVDNIRAAGFESFNVDLMYGFPRRAGRADPFLRTISDTFEVIQPDHITLYRMRYKGTKMAHLMPRVHLDQVNEQGTTAHYLLEEAGYTCNGLLGKNTYSRIPKDSGCSDYLDKRVREGIPYIGMGLGAQSFSRHTLQYNVGAVTKALGQYIRSTLVHGRIPIQDLYHLPPQHASGKFAAVSFYYGGIDLPAYADNFGVRLEDTHAEEVAFVLRHDLMRFTEDVNGRQRLQMTIKGKECFGGVVALFYAPSVKQHLVALEGGHDDVSSAVFDLDMSEDATRRDLDEIRRQQKQQQLEEQREEQELQQRRQQGQQQRRRRPLPRGTVGLAAAAAAAANAGSAPAGVSA